MPIVRLVSEQGTLFCNKCGKEKPAEDFPKDKSRPSGHHTYRLECRRLRRAELYRMDGRKEKVEEYNRIWKKANPDKVKQHRKNKLQKVRDNKIKLVQEMGGKCSVCGYDKSIASLEFHHVEEKTLAPADILHHRVHLTDEMLDELRSCILICSNCHHELHWGELYANS